MRLRKVGLMVATVGAAVSLGALSLASGTASATHQEKVTICHATSSDHNPYEEITVSASSIDELNNKVWNGHGDHTGPVWSSTLHGDWGDIIPPFGAFPGRNWTDAGKAILANGCEIPPPTTTTTVPDTTKVTICHATASDTNPYESITVTLVLHRDDDTLVAQPYEGDLNGHLGHTGPVWTKGIDGKWGDIIPPFTYSKHGDTVKFDGYNWTTAGRAIFDNGCLIPADPTTTTSAPTTTAPTTTAPTTTAPPATTAPPTTAATTTTKVEQEAPVTTTAVEAASGSIPSTGSEQTVLLVIGAAMALGGLLVTLLARRPHHA